MSRFVVDLGNLKLSEEHRQRIAAAIQGAVLQQLAHQPPPPPHYTMFPKEWLGFILRQELAQLAEAEKEAAGFVRQRAG